MNKEKFGKSLAILLLFQVLSACFDYELLSILSTPLISGVTASTAVSESTIVDLTGQATQHGHCWSTSPNPTIDLTTKSELGAKNDKTGFQSLLSNLNSATVYFIRAYAVVNGGVFYGKQTSFQTLTLTGTLKELATSSRHTI